jgi:hypothetical protein
MAERKELKYEQQFVFSNEGHISNTAIRTEISGCCCVGNQRK